MTTIQPALTPRRFRRPSAVLTAAGALIAVGIAALFLALAGSSRTSHVAIRHSVALYHGTYYPRVQHRGAYYPLIQYRGTGAGPAIATGGGRSVGPDITNGIRPTTPTTPTVVSVPPSYPVH